MSSNKKCPENSEITISTADKLSSFADVLPYINDCTSSTLSLNILSVNGVTKDGNNLYTVSYCCEESLSIDSSMCAVSWTYDCSTETYSSPEVTCAALFMDSFVDSNINESVDIIQNWEYWYSNDKSTAYYYRPVFYCNQGCFSKNINASFFTTPPLISSSICSTPTFTETHSPFTPTHTETITNIELFEAINTDTVLLCGDKPHFSHESVFHGVSEVTEKVNSTDSDYRVFYKSCGDYDCFYEHLATFINENQYGELISSDSNVEEGAINASNDFYLKTEPTETLTYDPTSCYKSDYAYSGSVFRALLGDYTPRNFASVLCYTSETPTITQNSEQLIKDESLFKKLFTKNTINVEDVNFNLCSLNTQYWFNELPSALYSIDDWLTTLDYSNLPHFVINQDITYNEGDYSFSSGELELYSTALNYNSDDNFLILKSYPFNFNFNDGSYFWRRYVDDPIYKSKIYVGSPVLHISLSYIFEPDVRFISSGYESFTSIKRTEKMSFHLNPFSGQFNSQNQKVLPEFAIDKTFPKFPPNLMFKHGLIDRLF